MALDARTVKSNDYELGDRVDVLFEDGRRTFTLVATIGFGENDSLLGATLAGFDLAVTAQAPIVAAQRGMIVHAGDLGIYGNCVIIDHGLGVQSLYGHMSSIEVQVGQQVEKAQQIGRSGMTGMAGGDHFHFTMAVNGKMGKPVEWGDAHWIEDRILRKLRRGGGQ